MKKNRKPLIRKKTLEIRSRYEQTAHIYDNRYREEQERKYTILLNEFPIQNSDFIADIGCGSGLLFEFLRNNLKSAVGIDISVKMVQLAKNRTPQNLFHWITADGEYLPFRQEIFDHVFFVTSLQNMANQDQALIEAFSSCKNGGLVYLSILKKNESSKKLNSILKKFKYIVMAELNFDELEDFIKILKKI